jgi:protein gp37
MGKDTAIQWANHTCNFWWGCEKISPACKNCYALAMAKRTGRDCFGDSPRYRTKGPWRDILKWDKSAGERGVRERVFVNSMSDIGEVNSDLDGWRDEAFAILAGLKNLDVLLLTKRPAWLGYSLAGLFDHIPSHFWLGVTAEDQVWFNHRAEQLLNIPHDKFFFSIEPMLSYVDLLQPVYNGLNVFEFAENGGAALWVIAGAESGAHMRTAKQYWFRALRDRCQEHDVPFMLKQMHVDQTTGSYTHKTKLVKEPFLDGIQHLAIPDSMK